MIPPTCRTCRFWNARYPQNINLGICRKAGVINWGNEVSILMRDANDQSDPTSDYEAVRTISTFGCIEHTLVGVVIRTLEMP